MPESDALSVMIPAFMISELKRAFEIGFLIALPTFFLPAMFVFYIAPFAMDPLTAGWL